jgi:hypothetical protein
LIWPENTIQNTWLEVTVLATGPNAIVDADYTFYFGNWRGEVGAGDTRLNSTDVGLVSANFSGIFPPEIELVSEPTDINKDGKTNSTDVGFISGNFTTIFPPGPFLALINPPGAVPGPAASGQIAIDGLDDDIEDAVDSVFAEIGKSVLF